MLDVTKSLPEDPAELRAFTALLLAEVRAQAVLIEKLRHQLASQRAHRFGASSETPDQLQLALEMSETAIATLTAKLDLPEEAPVDKPKRKPIPDHISRIGVELRPDTADCARCGGKLRRLGEDVTEELEYVPGRFVLNRFVRPRPIKSGRLVRICWRMCPLSAMQASPAGQRVNKYADHLPLYRQSQIFDRDGFDLDRSTLADWVGKSTALPEPLAAAIADEAITGIAALYAVENVARGSPPDKRVEIRQAEAKPSFDSLEAWLSTQLHDISGKSPLAAAIRYALGRMARLRPYLDHGIIEIGNNTAERAMRSVAPGRKNYLFVGSQTGGKSAAIAYTPIETAKLNGVDAQAWLADTLACIPDHKINRIDELLSWNTR